MPKAQRIEIFDVSQKALYSVITDFASTSEFVDGVRQVEVLEQDEKFARVRYSLNLIKEFSYILRLTLVAPERVEWELESGDILKQNQGHWLLEPMGPDQTQVTYQIEIDFKIKTPSGLMKRLVERNLPVMMKSYRDQTKTRGEDYESR